MKPCIVVLVCLLLSTSRLLAQAPDTLSVGNTLEYSPEVEVASIPEYPGGMQALREYLTTNIRYPEIAAQKGIRGMVVVGFIIAEDGSVKDVHIKESLSYACDREAMRVVRRMPKWKPSMIRGKPYPVKYTLPISFGR